ncbi:MAG TPA: transcriptional repressor [Rhodopila sp.]|uniref:transcriptional repressor n=1 Tax=Rhodopila sp. TaxID=2480087 RepID=UPI002B842FF2|nr:transcriptional repressor [Rhodopila sp.]HVY16046.1 transcriptional repressor [Rhodopila sp.]
MGFSPRTETLLNQASTICGNRGARLTDLRRQVLGLILDRESPTGAYDLLDQLRATRHGAAPPTVYRALEFLLDQGLIHKLERLSAYVGCVAQEDHDRDHDHAAQFFICRTCGRVTELEDHELAHALEDAAKRLGFTLGKATIEAEGQCAVCSAR